MSGNMEEQAEMVFYVAFEKGSADRKTYPNQACGGYATLCRRVTADSSTPEKVALVGSGRTLVARRYSETGRILCAWHTPSWDQTETAETDKRTRNTFVMTQPSRPMTQAAAPIDIVVSTYD